MRFVMSNKEKRYSIKAVKCFLENEINSVIKERNLVVKLRVFTKDEYFNSDIYKSYCDEGYRDYADDLYLQSNGFQLRNEIVIFLGKTSDEVEFGYNTREIIRLLSTSFHELAHQLQKNFDYYTNYLDLIYVLIEREVMCSNTKFYNNNWLNFFMEADADRFAFKALMDRKSKYPYLFEGNEDYLEKKRDDIVIRVETYDFGLIFNQFDLLGKNLNSSNPISMIMGIIYNSGTNKFNGIEDIADGSNELKFYELIYLVLGSESFLRTINFNDLNDNEIKIMKDVITKNYDEFCSKEEILESFSIKYKKDILIEKREMFEKRICQLENLLSRLNDLDKNKKRRKKLN